MTPLTLAILASLTALPQWHEHRGETPDETRARLTPVALGIAQAAERATCAGKWSSTQCERIWRGSTKSAAAMLITLGWWESRFSQRIIEHRCRPDECDPAKLKSGAVFHKAVGAWQIQAQGPISVREWRMLPSRPDLQAWAAMRVIAAAQSKCKTADGTIAMYATGRWCGWKGSQARVRTLRRVEERLR